MPGSSSRLRALSKKPERARVMVRGGRIWTIRKVPRERAEEEDFRFWYEGLSPEERVKAVGEALESCLKTRGRNAVPRLRRVHRRIRSPWFAAARSRNPVGRPKVKVDVKGRVNERSRSRRG